LISLTTYSCSAADASTSAAILLHCINDVDKWMSSNWLQLNAEKTQFIWLSSSQMLAKMNKEPLRIGGVNILPLDTVQDYGVVLDSNLTMKKHVEGIVVVASINFDNYGPFANH